MKPLRRSIRKKKREGDEARFHRALGKFWSQACSEAREKLKSGRKARDRRNEEERAHGADDPQI